MRPECQEIGTAQREMSSWPSSEQSSNSALASPADPYRTQNMFCSRSFGEQGAAFRVQLLQCHSWAAVAASVQRPLVAKDTVFDLKFAVQPQLLGAAEISPAVSQTKARGTDLALICQMVKCTPKDIPHPALPAPKMPSSGLMLPLVLKTGALGLSCSGQPSSTVPYGCLIPFFSKFCVFRNGSTSPSGPPKCCLKKPISMKPEWGRTITKMSAGNAGVLYPQPDKV